MNRLSRWSALEGLVVRDERFAFTIVAYFGVLLIFVNQVLFSSVVLGFLASFLFFFINSVFLGHALFRRDSVFVRFMLGGLVLLLLLGVVGWMVLIAYDLDAVLSTLVLVILVAVSSALNRLERRRGGEGR